MKKLILLSALVITGSAFADARDRFETLLDTLSSTPANVTGYISVGSQVELGRSPVDLGIIRPNARMQWRSNKAIGFTITDNTLQLNTQGAIVLEVMGVTLKVNSVRYTSSGRFQVDIDAPLIDGIAEEKVVKCLEDRFKAKMDQAFRELSAIRRNKGHGAKGVLDKIMDIFKDGSGPNMFNNVSMSGNVSLNFNFSQPRTFQVSDKYVADIQDPDTISVGTNFVRRNNRFTFNELQFNSSRGIIFRPENKSQLALGALRVSQITVSDRGIEPVMVSGAEDAVNDVRVLIGLIAAAQGAHELGRAPGCDPRIPEIQAYLQRELNGHLSPLIRQHRAALIQAGLDPQMLDALEG